MGSESQPDLSLFLPPEDLQEIADLFSATARVNTMICDSQGRLLVRAAPDVEFFKLVLPDGGRRVACRDDYAELVQVLASGARTARRVCLGGLAQVAVPIRGEDGMVGLVVATEQPTVPIAEERLTELSQALGLDRDRLKRAAADLPAWTPYERSSIHTLLRLVADMLGHLCRQESRLRDRIDDLGAIYSVAGLVSSTSDVQKILNSAAESVTRVMKAKAASIRLFEPESGELVISAVSNLSDTYLAKGPIKLERNPIDQAALRGEVVYIEDMSSDPRTLYPAQAKAEGIVSSLVAGMVFRGRPIGVIRVYSDRVRTFSAFDASLLRTVAAQVATAVSNARLHAEALEAERYTRQLDHAASVQRRMIPRVPPESDRVELAYVFHPSLALSGDFCDFISLPHGHIGVVIADVVGKGIAAALMMASVRSALRAHAHSLYDIDEIMRQVNRHMCRDTLVSEFATLFYGVFSADEPVLTYCNAGHEPPFLVRQGELIELESSGLAIGIEPDEPYQRHRLHVKAGDVLVLYTDGAVDATAFSDETFGRQRLREAILRYAHQSAEAIAHNILMDIRRFIGLANQVDDITLAVARYIHSA
jgi:sigma-B regulation protein RsbU (phosphoserine phosphatase)